MELVDTPPPIPVWRSSPGLRWIRSSTSTPRRHRRRPRSVSPSPPSAVLKTTSTGSRPPIFKLRQQPIIVRLLSTGTDPGHSTHLGYKDDRGPDVRRRVLPFALRTPAPPSRDCEGFGGRAERQRRSRRSRPGLVRRGEEDSRCPEAGTGPRTTRVLPWMVAFFIAILWLVPFEQIQLNASLPITLPLDRLVLPFLIGNVDPRARGRRSRGAATAPDVDSRGGRSIPAGVRPARRRPERARPQPHSGAHGGAEANPAVHPRIYRCS